MFELVGNINVSQSKVLEILLKLRKLLLNKVFFYHSSKSWDNFNRDYLISNIYIYLSASEIFLYLYFLHDFKYFNYLESTSGQVENHRCIAFFSHNDL